MAIGSDLKNLDPRWATDANTQRVVGLIYSSLLRYDDEMQFQGDLAQDWSLKENSIQFLLKPQIRFHDDEISDCEDWNFSLHEFVHNSAFSSQLDWILNWECKTELGFPTRLEIFKKNDKNIALYSLTSLKLIPLSKKDIKDAKVGSGPYRWFKQQSLRYTLKAFSNYSGELPQIKKLRFDVIKDASTRFMKLYQGLIDIVQNDIPSSKVQFFKNSSEFNVITAPSLSTTYLLFNFRNPLLKKRSLRHQIAQQIPIHDLIQYNLMGYGSVAYSLLPEQHPWAWNPKNSPVFTPEPWPIGHPPLVLKTSNSFEAFENGKVVSARLQQQKIPIKHLSYEWGTFYDDIKKGNFDLAIMKWVGVWEIEIYFDTLHSSMTPPGRNRGFYQNHEFDKKIALVLKSKTKEEEKRHSLEMQEWVYNDMPILPLWHEKQIAITHKRVKNYKIRPNGDFLSLVKATKE